MTSPSQPKDPPPFVGKRVLLAEDEEQLRIAMARILTGMGAEVLLAADGKVAQSILGVEPVDLVISDVRMPGCNGIELLHFVKRTKPELPVILTTGFGELRETKEAHELGARGFLAKPFSRDDLRKLMTDLIGVAPVDPEPVLRDEDYSKLSIDDFITGKQIKFDIFIRLAQDRYVKIAHEGDDLPVDRIRAYKSKNIMHLHMRKSDFGRYIGLNLEIGKKLAGSTVISKEKKVNFVKHTGELILEQCFLNDLNEGVFDVAKSAIETTVSVLFEMPDMAVLLTALNDHSDFLYAHCVGVSFYSSLIARAMSWENPRNLYKLSMAGLLHDIGKKELDPSLLKKSRAMMTAAEVKLYESHPSRGVEILSQIRAIPGDILQIVQQHHENCLGTGWPAALKRMHIHPMARVVSVADEFCRLVIKTPWSPALPVPEALERIYVARSQEFDRPVLEALIQIFNPQVLRAMKEAENRRNGGSPEHA
jgi:putative nucleotidyltransferase with HDIG domain